MAMRPNLWHLLLVLPLAGVFAFIAWKGKTLREDPADVIRHLKAQQAPSLPAAAAVSMSGRSEIELYDRETLYDFIDGAAEAFLARGFERCATATYTAMRDGGAALEVAAEVYRFATGDGARAQLEADRPGAARPPGGVPDALTDGSVLLLVKGRELLKLTALGRGLDATPELERIAREWAGERGT